MGGDLELAWYVIQPLIVWGFSVGVVLAIIFGAIRLGWKYAGWIVLISALIWFIGG